MELIRKISIITILVFVSSSTLSAQTDTIFKIFQFPADKIPKIDGKTDDWTFVPESYIMKGDHLRE